MGICTQYYFAIEIRDNDYVKNVSIHNQSNGHIIFDVTLYIITVLENTTSPNMKGITFLLTFTNAKEMSVN